MSKQKYPCILMNKQQNKLLNELYLKKQFKPDKLFNKKEAYTLVSQALKLCGVPASQHCDSLTVERKFDFFDKKN